jgi:hypothetical protein
MRSRALRVPGARFWATMWRQALSRRAMAWAAGDRTPGRQLARSLLFVACVGQAILSAGLLQYIHRTAVIEAEYGRTWRSQQPGFVATGS